MDRLSFLDAQFLHLEDERSPMHIAGLCTFEGPAPGRDEMRRLLLAKLALIPRYRQRVHTLPLEIGRPVWVDDARFDVDYHVRRTALPAPGDDAALCALMGRLMAQTLDRARPLWELWVVEGLEGGRWALISKVHHAMVDGIAGVALQGVLLDTERDRPLPPIVPWTPAPEPRVAALILDAWGGLAHDARRAAAAALAAARHPAAGAREARELATGLATFVRKLLRLRAGPLEGTIGPHRAYAHAGVSLADVGAIRRALGGSVNDVVLAAVSAGHRALLEHRGEDPARVAVRTLVPVSIRRLDERGALHNRVSAMLYDLPLAIADPVERLHAVSAGMARLKASHMADAGAWVVTVADLAPPMVAGAMTRAIARTMHKHPQRALATVITNVPGPRDPLHCLGRRMLAWYPYVPISQGLRVGTAILSYAGDLAFGITADPDTVPDAWVMARGIEREIASLRSLAAAGTTASSAGVPAWRMQ